MYRQRIVSQMVASGYRIILQKNECTILNRKESDYYKVAVIINNYGGRIVHNYNLDSIREKLDICSLFEYDLPHKYLFFLLCNDKKRKNKLNSRNVIICKPWKTTNTAIDPCFQDDLRHFWTDRKQLEMQHKLLIQKMPFQGELFPYISVSIAATCICLAFMAVNPDKFGLSPSNLIEKGRWYSLITYMFLHSGLLHLLGNIISMMIFGTMLEKRVGHLKFFILCLIGGTYAGLGSTIYKMDRGGNQVITVGLSGMIFAILGALIIYQFQQRHGIVWLVIYTLLALAGGLFRGGVDNIVHLIGLSAGIYIMGIYILLSQLALDRLTIKTIALKRAALRKW